MPSLSELLGRAAVRGREPLLYAVTPPRVDTPEETVRQLAERTLDRLDAMSADGLILYDLVDESERTDEERPFPFLETLDPAAYLADHLDTWSGPSVVYRCVGKHDEGDLAGWLTTQGADVGTVFVGAASTSTPVRTSLRRAQQVHREAAAAVPLGGVAIPERHRTRGDEHERLLVKQDAGCSFFVTQVVYDVGVAKDLASDYFYACRSTGRTPAPVVFTLSLCGSPRTLDFLRWLGVDVPRWVSNEMLHAEDTLAASLAHCIEVAHELTAFCRYLGLPFGFNIESVSTRRVEIEATVELAQEVGRILRA